MVDDWQHVLLSTRSRLSLASLGFGAVALVCFLSVSDSRAAPKAKAAALGGHEVVFADSGNPSLATLKSVRAECPIGTGVIAGGFSFSNTGIDDYVLIDNHPSGGFTVQEPGGQPVEIGSGWSVTVRRLDGQQELWSLQAYAVCVSTE